MSARFISNNYNKFTYFKDAPYVSQSRVKELLSTGYAVLHLQFEKGGLCTVYVEDFSQPIFSRTRVVRAIYHCSRLHCVFGYSPFLLTK